MTTTKEALEPRLLPCPLLGHLPDKSEFTNGPYIAVSGAPNMPKFYAVVCPGCCSTAYDEDKERVIKKWNSRVTAPIVAPVVDGISWTALLSVLERLKSKTRNPDAEWYHGWNAAIQCLINDINGRRRTAPASPAALRDEEMDYTIDMRVGKGWLAYKEAAERIVARIADNDCLTCKHWSSEAVYAIAVELAAATTPPSTLARKAAEEIHRLCDELAPDIPNDSTSYAPTVAQIERVIIERCFSAGPHVSVHSHHASHSENGSHDQA